MALAHYLGRGSIIFWGLLLSMACNIWAASMTQVDQYIPFTMSRWLGSTFGAFPTALGGGYIIDLWFLHQRGKAFACYTTCALFGISFANTLSGFIVNDLPVSTQYQQSPLNDQNCADVLSSGLINFGGLLLFSA